jgi:hypothetical protein
MTAMDIPKSCQKKINIVDLVHLFNKRGYIFQELRMIIVDNKIKINAVLSTRKERFPVISTVTRR